MTNTEVKGNKIVCKVCGKSMICQGPAETKKLANEIEAFKRLHEECKGDTENGSNG